MRRLVAFGDRGRSVPDQERLVRALPPPPPSLVESVDRLLLFLFLPLFRRASLHRFRITCSVNLHGKMLSGYAITMVMTMQTKAEIMSGSRLVSKQ